MATFSQRVTDANDGLLGGSVSGVFTSAALTIPATNATHGVLTRFTSVPVPQGASVSSAVLTYALSSGTNRAGRVVAFDLDNAPAPANGVYKVHASGPPTATTADAVTGTGSPRTVDVTALVQAVVNRAGWVAGNAVAFLIRRDGTTSPDMIFAGNDAGNATLLEITYEILPAEGGGDLAANVLLDGVGGIAAAAAGGIGVQIALAGAGQGTSAGAGGIGIEISLAGQGASLVPGAGSGPLTVDLDLTGSGAATATGSGDLPTHLTLTATGARPSAAAGAITVNVLLAGAGNVPELPPVPPWQEFIRSATYRNLYGTIPTRDFRAEVVDEDDAILGEVPISGGTVTIDREQRSRRTASVAIPDVTWYPRSPTDLLSKASQNRLRIWERVLIGPGQWGQVPLATVYLKDPAIRHYADTPVEFSIDGEDAASTIAPYRDLVDVSGLRADLAVQLIVSTVAPWIQTALTPVDYYLPGQYEAGVPGADPMTDIDKIAEAAACEVFVDRMGVMVMRPEPTGLDVDADWTDGVIGGLDVEPDRSYCNHVTILSANPEIDPPIVAVWRDEDPSSPLALLDPRAHVYPVRIESGIVSTQAQADTYARNEGMRRQQGIAVVKGVAFPDPAREPGDVVLIDDDVTGRAGPHRLQAITVDLEPDALMGFQATGALTW